MSEQLLTLVAEVQKAVGTEEYDARFIMSAATPDRVADTIDPSVYTKLAKAKKVIALWQHDKTQPIGYWAKMEKSGDTLTGYLKLSQTNLGFMVKQMLEDGVPLGASIGFRGKGTPNKKGGLNFTELDLMECSVVSTPAHPRAQQIAKSFDVELVKSHLDDEARAKAIAIANAVLALTKG